MPLADLLSCPEDQLLEAITSEEPYSLGTWFLAKGISAIELCQLGENLGVAAYDDLMDGFRLVGEPLPEGPWPETIPPELVDKISRLTDAEISAAAPQWAQIEEFHGAAPPDSLAEYLRSLRAFFTQNRGAFYLVNSL